MEECCCTYPPLLKENTSTRTRGCSFLLHTQRCAVTLAHGLRHPMHARGRHALGCFAALCTPQAGRRLCSESSTCLTRHPVPLVPGMPAPATRAVLWLQCSNRPTRFKRSMHKIIPCSRAMVPVQYQHLLPPNNPIATPHSMRHNKQGGFVPARAYGWVVHSTNEPNPAKKTATPLLHHQL